MVADPEDLKRNEKKFDLSMRHIGKVYDELKEAKTVIEILE